MLLYIQRHSLDMNFDITRAYKNSTTYKNWLPQLHRQVLMLLCLSRVLTIWSALTVALIRLMIFQYTSILEHLLLDGIEVSQILTTTTLYTYSLE